MDLTIFTPVYNRAKLLPTLYESLQNQTNHEFTWLIVDDGSTDNVSELISEFQKQAKFEIRYIYQENSGKHSAHNKGVENCNTDLFFCVDSDDYLSDDAVEKIYKTHRKYQEYNLLGYYFRKKDTKNRISGGNFPIKGDFVGLREIYFRYGFVGELAIVLRAKHIKEFSFPVYENEKFVSESVFYNQITSIAPMAYIDDVIYIFEYQETGYTMNSNKLLAKNPKGGAMGFLSDAIYGTKFINRAKAFGAFESMKKTFQIPNGVYTNYKVPLLIKLAGYLLKAHYNRLFRIINQEYNGEKE